MTAESVKDRLISDIKNRRITVGIIGLGYVGLPLAVRFAEQGFRVLGFDTDPQKIEQLSADLSYIRHIPADAVRRMLPLFSSTHDMGRLGEPEAIIVCVPTPLDHHRQPDLTFLTRTAQDIGNRLRRGQIVSLESTTYPGTTRELYLARFARTGLRAGEDFFLVFSPEREDPANPNFTTKTIPKLVGGITPACSEVGAVLYGEVVDRVVPVSSPEVAESAKLLENIYRAVNIALVNELKVLFDRMGIDIWEVIEAARTKPFGYQPFYPGPGLGGHCIPVDPFYLTWRAREFDIETRFIELAGVVNNSMPYYVVEKTVDALASRGKVVRGARILLVGLAYKKDVDDIRESPAFALMKILLQRGAQVDYYDPYVPRVEKTRQFDSGIVSIDPVPERLRQYDAAIIVTDHSCVDYQSILSAVPLVVDTRNVYQGRHPKVVRA